MVENLLELDWWTPCLWRSSFGCGGLADVPDHSAVLFTWLLGGQMSLDTTNEAEMLTMGLSVVGAFGRGQESYAAIYAEQIANIFPI